MTVIYEQEKDRPKLQEQPKRLFWKPDGKVIIVEGDAKIKEAIARSWRQLTDKERERFKPGSYNPVYDMRGQKVVSFSSQDFTDGQRKDIVYFDVIVI